MGKHYVMNNNMEVINKFYYFKTHDYFCFPDCMLKWNSGDYFITLQHSVQRTVSLGKLSYHMPDILPVDVVVNV